MAEISKNSTGFATMAQQGGGGGKGSKQVSVTDPEEKKTAELINKAIQEYDKYIKEYLIKAFLFEEIPKQTILDYITYYMGDYGFIDRKITDTPTDAYSIVNRKFVATGVQPSSPVVGQSYFDGSKQQFWSGSSWVTWPTI